MTPVAIKVGSSLAQKIPAGKVLLREGSYLVRSGVVCAITMGEKESSCVVFAGDVIFIPYGFYLYAVVSAEIIGCAPVKQQYDTFIADQMDFVSIIKRDQAINNVYWFLRRMATRGEGKSFKINRTHVATALSMSREWVCKAVTKLVSRGTIQHNEDDNTYRVGV